MSNLSETRHETVKLTGIAILSALIIVLQSLSNFVSFGAVSITLALTPIIIGAAVYGPTVGAMLGFVLSCIVLVSGLLGWDKGFVLMLMDMSPIGVLVIIFVKSPLAGWVSGLIYRGLEKKNSLAAVIAAGILCPVINTGMFILLIILFYNDYMCSLAGDGGNVLLFAVTAFVGVNFLVEVIVNMVLSTGADRIIRQVKKA